MNRDKRIIKEYCQVNKLNARDFQKQFEKEEQGARKEFIDMAQQNIYQSQHAN